MDPDPGQVTQLLQKSRDGDREAANQLLPLVYRELRGLARHVMKGREGAPTLQPTALVHEAWLRLFQSEAGPAAESHLHFVRIAARAMRAVMVDHVRARNRDKRGGGRERVPLDDVVQQLEERACDLLDLDAALDRLAGMDDRLARIVELRFFGGLTIEQTAHLLEVSEPTVERCWRTARTFLRHELRSESKEA